MPYYEDFGSDFHYYHKTHKAKGVVQAHLHPGYELGIYLHDSPHCAEIHGQEFFLPYPTAILFAPFCLHKNSFEFRKEHTEWERAIFYFGDETIQKYTSAFSDLKLGHNRIWRLNEKAIREFHEILDMMNRCPLDSVEQQLLFLLILRRLFSMTDEEIPVASIADGGGYISDVIRYMSENLSDGLTAEGVAAHFFISRSKLNKDFKKYTSTTFHQLLGEMKMNKAIGFLKDGVTDIRKVAIASGFENENYFFTLFKKRKGVTPLQYAKQYREKRKKEGIHYDPRMVSSEWGMSLDF